MCNLDEAKGAIRKMVQQCILSSVMELEGTNATRKSNLTLLENDQLSIVSESDWKILGEKLEKNLKSTLDDKNQDLNPLPQYSFFFMANFMGQDRAVSLDDFSRIDKSELVAEYSNLRIENIDEIALHWATDFTSNDPERYITLFNTKFIKSLSLGGECEYFPQAGLGGAGNMQFNFGGGHSVNKKIKALQVYIQWTDILSKVKKNYYTKARIAREVAQLSKNTVTRKLMGEKKTRMFDVRHELLDDKPSKKVEFQLKCIETGELELRVEAVWSSNCNRNLPNTLGEIFAFSHRETMDWMDSVKISQFHFQNGEMLFWSFDKTEFSRWARGIMIPCSNTIRQKLKPFKGIKDIPSILNVSVQVILIPQEYRNIVAAEAILAYFLLGRKQLIDGCKSSAKTFGFQLSSCQQKTFQLKNVEIREENGVPYIHYTGPEGLIPIPKWMEDKRLGFLRIVMTSMNRDQEALSEALLKYCLAHACLLKFNNAIPDPLTLFCVWDKQEGEVDQQCFVITTAEMVSRFQRKLLIQKEDHLEFDCATELMKRVFEKKILQPLQLRQNLDEFIRQDKRPFLVPFPGNQLYAAIPVSKRYSESKEIWISVFNWLTSRPLSTKLTEAERERLDVAYDEFYQIPCKDRENANIQEYFDRVRE